MGDFIGAGNFGQVHRAMEVESGKIITVKTIPINNSVNRDLLNVLEVNLRLEIPNSIGGTFSSTKTAS